MNAPIILRRQFKQKGFTIIRNSLSQANTKMNEFVELMRMDGLSILNGCKDPDSCECNFRHKRCRLFIARYSSDSGDFKLYSSNCNGIMRIRVDNERNNAYLSGSIISDGASDIDSTDSIISSHSCQSNDDSEDCEDYENRDNYDFESVL